MPRHVRASEDVQKSLRDEIARTSLAATAHKIGLDRETVRRAARGDAISVRSSTMLAKFPPRVRTEDEFSKPAAITAPPLKQGPYAWDLETIRTARDAQLRGEFDLPVRMAEAMRTDDALFIPYRNRCKSQAAIETRLVPAEGARGAGVAHKAVVSAFAPRSVINGIHGTLINHGIAIGFLERETNDDGTRVDLRLTEWPLEYVRWRPWERALITQTREGPTVTINHGDGQWIVFRSYHTTPWTQDACLLSAALVWAAHANGIKDWASSSRAHGLAKIFGELQAGVSLADAAGNLTPEARAFLQMLTDVISGDSIAGIRPSNTKTDVVANNSTAWQIFVELVTTREKAGARVYLGTDAILGSVGGAPGVDITQLFSIASTILQGDLKAIEDGLRTGLYEPWAAINFGDSRYAPSFKYQVPDPDAEERSAQRASALDRLFAALDGYAKAGLVIDDKTVARLAAQLGVDDPPTLVKATVQVDIDPASKAKVVTVNEARQAQGLPPLNDERGNLTITEIEALAKEKAAATPAPGVPPGSTPPAEPAAPTPPPTP